MILALVAYGGRERVATVKIPKTYDKDGIQFQLPSNWQVTADSQCDGVRNPSLETPGQATVTTRIFWGLRRLKLRVRTRLQNHVLVELRRWLVTTNLV